MSRHNKRGRGVTHPPEVHETHSPAAIEPAVHDSNASADAAGGGGKQPPSVLALAHEALAHGQLLQTVIRGGFNRFALLQKQEKPKDESQVDLPHRVWFWLQFACCYVAAVLYGSEMAKRAFAKVDAGVATLYSGASHTLVRAGARSAPFANRLLAKSSLYDAGKRKLQSNGSENGDLRRRVEACKATDTELLSDGWNYFVSHPLSAIPSALQTVYCDPNSYGRRALTKFGRALWHLMPFAGGVPPPPKPAPEAGAAAPHKAS